MNETKVYLRNGDVIDITGLSPADAIARLRAQGVTSSSQIEHTVHRLGARVTSLRAPSSYVQPTLEVCMTDAIKKFGETP